MMDSYEILQKVVSVLKNKLGINVYMSYSPNQFSIPSNHPMITVDIKSGSASKIVLDVNIYVPEFFGSKTCRELAKKTEQALALEEYDNYKGLTVKSVGYDKKAHMYTQSMEVLFQTEEVKGNTFPINFGDTTIKADGDTGIKISRIVKTYYSPISGVRFQDLGVELKEVTGTATMKKDQFNLLKQYIKTGESKQLNFGGERFNASLISLSGRGGGKSKFTFIEVPT